ncbi:MAG: DUF4422 domain-containing protein [Selenomonadaceae bacterium]|nr:DUF4422 domain-containing protein [Selenomonadaceae bacterium]
MATYIPRILLCGNIEEFKQTIGDRPVEIVGMVSAERTEDNLNLFLDGKKLTDDDIAALTDGTFDYLVFTDKLDYTMYLKYFSVKDQATSSTAFAKNFRDGFFTFTGLLVFCKILNDVKFFNHVLDYDCFLSKSGRRKKDYLNVEIDCIAENSSDNIFPIMENLYDKIYATTEECRYHIFDAVILTRERTPDEFIDTIISTDNLSKRIMTFVRKNSPLETWLSKSKNIFADVKPVNFFDTKWYVLTKNMPKDDVGIYVVTHKDIKLKNLPEGYYPIHAGHAAAQNDFGYRGDDTGDNISNLNKFLDEVTALYWIWKNTTHTHTGFVHYRRFLTGKFNQPERRTNSYLFDTKDILSKEEILTFLDEYDIIVSAEITSNRSQLDLMVLSTEKPDLVHVSEQILLKHLKAKQPDYLDAYDNLINSNIMFPFGIQISRRSVFNAYCEWLFSFILDATIEMRDKLTIDGYKFEEFPHIYTRMMSFFAERMLTLWLMKNHLKIKTLPIMYRDDV